jgi:hypothetical protein
MPRVPGRLGRLLLSLVFGIGLAAMPAATLAVPPVKHTEHVVFFSCFFADGEVEVRASISEFGAEAFVGSPDFSGGTLDGVVVTETGGGATIDATILLFDSEGTPIGEAVLMAILTPNGQDEVIAPTRERFGNHWVRTEGFFRGMDVSGRLTLADTSLDLSTGDCFGQIGDIQVHETPPETFVLNNSGVVIDCHWETADSFASLFVINDTFGTFADVHLDTAGHSLFTAGDAVVTLTTTELSLSTPLFDAVTRMDEMATASASIQPLGGLVTSTFLEQNARNRVTEQRLIPSGTLTFSTGQTFTLDGEACFGSDFESHLVVTAPSGPKPGATTAANDTADGAVALSLGKIINDQTRNTAVAPELPVEACPEPDDRFGHTLWYTFTGTGGPVTIDTAGSNFDTVIAVYDAGLNLLACNDDVEFEPIGGTLQAALSIDTDAGATYYLQAGGFDPVSFTGVSEPQFGRLRIRIS